MVLIIDSVTIVADETITEHEIKRILADERLIWLAKGKTLGRLEMVIEGDEIVVKSFERSSVKRVRRLTGYLAEIDRFNDAKKFELINRKPNM
jgi:anaerobic ribonucleoside-triphosphate reductase activating protein